MFPKIGCSPKSSILMGLSIINHPFWGPPLFLETPIWILMNQVKISWKWHQEFEELRNKKKTPGHTMNFVKSCLVFMTGSLQRFWVVVLSIHVHPYLGEWSNLTNIFQMGWNQQLEMACYSCSPNVTECNGVNISSRKKTKIAPAKLTSCRSNFMVARLLSFWEGVLPRRVNIRGNDIIVHQPNFSSVIFGTRTKNIPKKIPSRELT